MDIAVMIIAQQITDGSGSFTAIVSASGPFCQSVSMLQYKSFYISSLLRTEAPPGNCLISDSASVPGSAACHGAMVQLRRAESR